MDRRNIFKATLAVLGLAAAAHAKAEPASGKHAAKVVYHLADPEKGSFVLGNLRHHWEGTGGPGKVALAVVVHGPALSVFRATTTNHPLRKSYDEAVKAGVAFFACIHTLTGMKLSLADLLPGFQLAADGGVVKLADLQADGWAYLRP